MQKIIFFVVLVAKLCLESSVTPRTVVHQAPLSMGFSRQEYWSGLPFLSPGESSPHKDQNQVSCTADSLPLSHQGANENHSSWNLHWIGKGVASRGDDRLEKMQRLNDEQPCGDARPILRVGDHDLWVDMVVMI